MSKRKVAVVMDSTANLSPEMLAENDLETIPLNLIWGGESYRDGVDITTDEFDERRANSVEGPTTAQPAGGEGHEFVSGLAGPSCGSQGQSSGFERGLRASSNDDAPAQWTGASF